MPINRNITVIKLYETILGKYPYLGEGVAVDSSPPADVPPVPSTGDSEGAVLPECMKVIGIAKGFATGPPLTLKSALKLKWNDDAIVKDIAANPKNTIDKMPIQLRDGSVLVVRSQSDFERARAVAQQAKKLANASNENAGPPAGTSSATRARIASRGGSRARLAASNSSGSMREPSLKINSDSTATTSTGIGLASDAGDISSSVLSPGGPLRTIQALKDSTNLQPAEQ